METSLYTEVVFILMAIGAVASGAVVAFARNIAYAAFALLVTLLAVAGLYVLAGADFLAAAQLLIYVGGVLVLVVFGIMLSHRVYDVKLRFDSPLRAAPAAVLIGVLLVGMMLLVTSTAWPEGGERGRLPAPSTEELGYLLMGELMLPFELASFLLLVALVGATYLTRRQQEAEE